MDPPGEDFYKIYIEILNDEQQIEDIAKLFSLDTTGHNVSGGARVGDSIDGFCAALFAPPIPEVLGYQVVSARQSFHFLL